MSSKQTTPIKNLLPRERNGRFEKKKERTQEEKAINDKPTFFANEPVLNNDQEATQRFMSNVRKEFSKNKVSVKQFNKNFSNTLTGFFEICLTFGHTCIKTFGNCLTWISNFVLKTLKSLKLEFLFGNLWKVTKFLLTLIKKTLSFFCFLMGWNIKSEHFLRNLPFFFRFPLKTIIFFSNTSLLILIIRYFFGETVEKIYKQNGPSKSTLSFFLNRFVRSVTFQTFLKPLFGENIMEELMIFLSLIVTETFWVNQLKNLKTNYDNILIKGINGLEILRVFLSKRLHHEYIVYSDDDIVSKLYDFLANNATGSFVHRNFFFNLSDMGFHHNILSNLDKIKNECRNNDPKCISAFKTLLRLLELSADLTMKKSNEPNDPANSYRSSRKEENTNNKKKRKFPDDSSFWSFYRNKNKKTKHDDNPESEKPTDLAQTKNSNFKNALSSVASTILPGWFSKHGYTLFDVLRKILGFPEYTNFDHSDVIASTTDGQMVLIQYPSDETDDQGVSLMKQLIEQSELNWLKVFLRLPGLTGLVFNQKTKTLFIQSTLGLYKFITGQGLLASLDDFEKLGKNPNDMPLFLAERGFFGELEKPGSTKHRNNLIESKTKFVRKEEDDS